ncbi:hypothetical protein [Xanthobacter flavus]|uniref:hypothetical protein n=1 Tax=Xanthobacter flavus TaxID=281 RepID=UPI00372B0F82
MPYDTRPVNVALMPTSSHCDVLKMGIATITAEVNAPSNDPVFAAIDDFREKRVAFNAALKELGEYEDLCTTRGVSCFDPTPEGDVVQGRSNAACDADTRAWWDFLNTTPTSREGLFAYLAVVTDQEGHGTGPVDEITMGAVCRTVRSFVVNADQA